MEKDPTQEELDAKANAKQEAKVKEEQTAAMMAYQDCDFSPMEVDQIVARCSTSEGGGESSLRRRGCNVPIFPQMAIPGALTKPIKLGIVELDSDGEMKAYIDAGGVQIKQDDDDDQDAAEGRTVNISQQGMMVAFGKAALLNCNGRRLTNEEKRVFWEIIGMEGRLAVGTAYLQHCTGAGKGFLQLSMGLIETY